MIKSLTCDMNRRTYMSHGSCQRSPEGRTAQLGSHPAAAACAPARGCRAPCPRLLHLQAPGLSISRTGSPPQTSSPSRRCQSVLHRESLAQSGRQTPRLRRFHRIDLERNRQSCLLGGTASRGRSWLTGLHVGNGRYGWNINLIDCRQRSWRKRMSCSCPPESGRQRGSLPEKPAAIRRF